MKIALAVLTIKHHIEDCFPLQHLNGNKFHSLNLHTDFETLYLLGGSFGQIIINAEDYKG